MDLAENLNLGNAGGTEVHSPGDQNPCKEARKKLKADPCYQNYLDYFKLKSTKVLQRYENRIQPMGLSRLAYNFDSGWKLKLKVIDDILNARADL